METIKKLSFKDFCLNNDVFNSSAYSEYYYKKKSSHIKWNLILKHFGNLPILNQVESWKLEVWVDENGKSILLTFGDKVSDPNIVINYFNNSKIWIDNIYKEVY